jgi:hypothetical protein
MMPLGLILCFLSTGFARFSDWGGQVELGLCDREGEGGGGGFIAR